EIANRGASLRREIALRPIRNRESAGSRHLVPSCAIRAVIATRGSLRTLGSAAMQRLRRAAFPLALAATLALAAGILVDDSAAELENQVFTSRADRLRIVVPRGWRASDQPSYPGLLLWMAPNQIPGQAALPGQIQLTVESFTRDLYCSWPASCRASHEGLPSKYACALRAKLESKRLRVE